MKRRDVTCANGNERNLGPCDIHVWYRITESLDPVAIELASTYLSDQERSRCSRLRFAEDRRDYTVAHNLLRRSLSRYVSVAPAEWQFYSGANGKPFIQNSGFRVYTSSPLGCRLSFSLSHTRGLVACAIARHPHLGLDVERVDRGIAVKEIAENYFSPREIANLRACRSGEQATRFSELWTLKEAFLKATGAGLSEPLSNVCFEFIADGSIILSSPSEDAQSWHFGLFAPSHHTRMAIAVSGDGCDALRFIARLAEPDASLAIQPLGPSSGRS